MFSKDKKFNLDNKAKLSFTTLDKKDLFVISGGMLARDQDDICTCDTWSVCHIDGAIDSDN
jgi:hypothetical protein